MLWYLEALQCAAIPLRANVTSPRFHAHFREHSGHVCHEAIRATEVDIRITRNTDFFEDGSRQIAGSVEVLAHLVLRAGPAIANKTASVGKRAHSAADFCSERMMLPVASGVQP